MRREYPFVWLDVFTDTPREGNQLAVFPDARGLSDDEMASIAREMHLSETTFVFPEGDDSDRQIGYRTRIFAVAGEMPFAGHPTLGTAAVLARDSRQSPVTLRLNVGPIPVTVAWDEERPYGEMTQNDPTFGQTHDRDVVARALRVPSSEIDPGIPIQTVSTGNPVAIVPFLHLQALTEARPNLAEMTDYLQSSDAQFFYLVSAETVDPTAALHARLIFSGGEDPATGSAAGPAVAWLVRYGRNPPGQTAIIEQGLEVKRPSRIFTRADLVAGAVRNVRVGGHSVEVIRGRLTL